MNKLSGLESLPLGTIVTYVHTGRTDLWRASGATRCFYYGPRYSVPFDYFGLAQGQQPDHMFICIDGDSPASCSLQVTDREFSTAIHNANIAAKWYFSVTRRSFLLPNKN